MIPHFEHQIRLFEETKDLPAHALFWEQGTGKTRTALDTITYLFEQGNIDGALVVAPNDVHRAWIEDQLPQFAPSLEGFFWTSSKASSLSHERMIGRLYESRRPIMAMGYDGFMTVRGRTFAKRFFKDRRAILILDESTAIKTPKTKVARALVNAGTWVAYRRVMTGTPITNAPWDVWSSIKFLDPTFWPRKGLGSTEAFRVQFAEWEEGKMRDGNGRLRTYPKLIGYRNLERLHEYLSEISSRVLKENVLDLPPKLFSKRHFELSPEQREVYDQLRDEFRAWVNGHLYETTHALTRMLRLAQVAAGYLPSPNENEPAIPIGKKNPRLNVLESAVAEIGHQAIINARFNADVDSILALLGSRAVRFDGRDNSDERARAKATFLAGDVQFFVTKPAVSGTGHTFTNAKTILYYTNDFSLENRLQSEDRAHRAGQTNPVSYLDFVAIDTIDELVVSTLLRKESIASLITNGTLNWKEWL